MLPNNNIKPHSTNISSLNPELIAQGRWIFLNKNGYTTRKYYSVLQLTNTNLPRRSTFFLWEVILSLDRIQMSVMGKKFLFAEAVSLYKMEPYFFCTY